MKLAIEKISEIPYFQSAVKNISAGLPNLSLGIIRSARLPVTIALKRSLNRPFLYITGRTKEALIAIDEYSVWEKADNPLYFPEPSTTFYNKSNWGLNTTAERISTLLKLTKMESTDSNSSASFPFVISPIRAIMTRSMPKDIFIKNTLKFKIGGISDPVKLSTHLIQKSYDNALSVIEPGQTARRGGIVDLWPPSDNQPTRIDFFGDEIESIRRFDPSNQRSTDIVKEVIIPPAREILYGDVQNEQYEGENLLEFNISLTYPNSTNLIDYLPANTIIAIESWEELSQITSEIEEQAYEYRLQAIKTSEIPNDFPSPFTSFSEIQDQFQSFEVIELGSANEQFSSGFSNVITPGKRFGGQLNSFIKHINEKSNKKGDILIVSRQATRLEEMWRDSVNDMPFKNNPIFKEATISGGWKIPSENNKPFELITDSEIFGWIRPEPRIKTSKTIRPKEGAVSVFKENQLVVHVDHGIGRFKGLVERSVGGNVSDYFCVEFAAGDQLYVPVHQVDRLSLYIGASKQTPSMSRLGGAEWKRVKSNVRLAVQDIADDLLKLYANRKIVSGFQFSKDTPWQFELEASFPYEETDDQIRVINEVKNDMEKPLPMDRLICGDVGYGKTEVAIRAAFKAVQDGKQVAMLVPTTILAQQHYETFRDRLSVFPVEVEMLSRFRSAKEQSDIVARLSKGTVDIIIGTHRLVQSDIKFNDLGLIIIDEEQRFGVAHKEYLKKMRSEIDVLTMTATPIPRTLYLALTGVRDISTIDTAPADRLPIISYTGNYSPKIVRQAILREIERGGQVFFVHNRVQTILAMLNQISKLVPEAKITVAHGQMNEKELAEKMKAFISGDYDVLLSTSIIESGLDIPNANTIIIDRADTFGLAQLYQLRGRVGRSSQRGYAYFFKHKNHSPTEEGKMRLETIAEYSHLGAGYSIAMRDLEIRGTGDILGSRQHGHISAVGFNLYTRLLNQAVTELKKTGNLSFDIIKSTESIYRPMINVDLPMTINIPEEYVSDMNERVIIYGRLASIHDLGNLTELESELSDRFGKLPQEVRNLLYQIKVKIIAETIGLSSISVENNQIVLRFPPRKDNTKSRNYPVLPENVRTSKNTIWIKLSPSNNFKNELSNTLMSLENYKNSEALKPA